MNLTDLKEKAILLTKALRGTNTKVDCLNIYIQDKEVFKNLHKECEEPKIYEPNGALTDYWFIVNILGVKFMINYKAKCVTTYEAL